MLQESLHALAMEHHELEKSYSHTVRARSLSIEDEFYDCDNMDDDVGKIFLGFRGKLF